MKDTWHLHRIGSMIGNRDTTTELPDGRCVPATPTPFYNGLIGRIRGAWAVIRGRAFPVVWPSDEEVANAVERYRARK